MYENNLENVLRDVDLEYYDNNNHNVKNPPLLKVKKKNLL